MPPAFLRLGSSLQAHPRGQQGGVLRQNALCLVIGIIPVPYPCRCCLAPATSVVALASVPGAPPVA